MTMTLDTLFQSLSYGELTSLDLANDGTGGIRADRQPQIIAALNKTLERLNTQFILKRRTVRVFPKTGRELYPLDPQFLLDTDPVDGFLQSLDDEEFTGDINSILEVRLPGGAPAPQNDPTRPDAIKTSSSSVSFNPEIYRYLKWIEVDYRPPVQKIDLNPSDYEVEIDIPAELFPALGYGIASHIYGGMAGQEHQLLAQSFEARYQQAVQEIATTDRLHQTTATEGHKAQMRGFP